MAQHGRHIEVRGVVQGVGFRPWVFQLAQRDHVAGTVWNHSTGVAIDAFGDEEALERFTSDLRFNAPAAAVVRDISWRSIAFREGGEFTIAESAESSVRRVTIPPDLATCDECLGEIFDPANRRYFYAFTNCTNCGPRYSIVKDVPYDRETTTMASFTMCEKCRREYEDPHDRRFHAQPNACPACGPKLVARTPEGREVKAVDAIAFASRAIGAQFIVAVKGLGGFHLACDATSSTAVQRLRDRKQREAKPLAVMVRDLDEARAIADLSAEEERALTSVERPIVLATRRERSGIAPEVTGENPLIGIFLPYTPLHHILLHECARPLVMTSGNQAEEPMVWRNEEALEKLGGIADVFLLHNREIESRVDDSIVRVIDNQPTVFRRARGYVPRGFEIAREFAQPVLACGAHLKNTFCIGVGNAAFVGPHIGDLETVETLRAYESAIEKMKTFIGVEPALVAYDLHPDYFSTRYALALPNVRTVAVQHHHAHVASAMAEHGLDGTVVGVAYDGTGYGTDGTSWGGEILIARYEGFQRFATFRGIPLAGGDQAIRQVWRIALAVLDQAFDGEPPLHAIPLFRAIQRRAIDSVRRMIEGQVNSPHGRGVGRYFDALGAIGLAMPRARYEGEVAFQWNVAADPHETGRYPVVIREGVMPWEIDLRPLVKAAVEDLIAGRSAATISARFHNTLADVTVEVARAAASASGDVPVVLTGGCFQNARLAEDVLKGLRSTNRVFTNHSIPPGDGGLSLGQALIADAVARRSAISDSQQSLTEAPVCA
jgi:hydrogenase maturation protein HypF